MKQLVVTGLQHRLLRTESVLDVVEDVLTNFDIIVLVFPRVAQSNITVSLGGGEINVARVVLLLYDWLRILVNLQSAVETLL